MKQNELFVKLAEQEGLTTYHYKVILLLIGKKEATQSQIAQELGICKQNINKVFKDLSSIDIVLKSRVEGRNIFWKINPEPKFQIKGQIRLGV